jgi:hypothetical protein
MPVAIIGHVESSAFAVWVQRAEPDHDSTLPIGPLIVKKREKSGPRLANLDPAKSGGMSLAEKEKQRQLSALRIFFQIRP